MTLAVGTPLGPYEVTAFLGSGGMAEVYRARDTRLGREVAVKILPEHFASDREALARFEREARTASSLNHPHLVTIFDIGQAEVLGQRLHYMAMELIHGDTLRHRLQHESRDTLLGLVADVADGLAKAHDAGVVHRDLKPENVMVSEDGFAKVVDFGLARSAPGMDSGSGRLTAEGYTVGTIGYMAPEQVRGARDVDSRADIFAIGCILYEAIARENPFDGDSSVDTLHRILYREPPVLQDAAIEPIVRRCLAKDPNDRYASMREVSAAIRAAIGTPVRRPIRRSWWYAGAALLALALATGGALMIERDRRPAIESIAVIPFQSTSGNEELRFLTDGIAGEVVRDLGRIPTLRVIASSSAARFRDTADPRKAARELGVDAVLVGRLRMVADRALLDAELVKAADGTAIWGKRYERRLTDLVALEQEIARDLCAEVRIELVPQQSRHTPDPQAHQAYLRGRRELAKETGAGLTTAIEYFNQAIRIDPEYALPHAGLAHAYGRQTSLGLVPTRDGNMLEMAAARRALALDEAVPEAHYSLAHPASLMNNDEEYERHATRALQLNPNYAPALLERAVHLVLEGRYDEADDVFRQVRAIDPLSPRVMAVYGIHLGLVAQTDRAIAVLRNATTQFPDDVNTQGYLALMYSYAGRHAEALAAVERIGADRTSFAVYRALVLARAGRKAEAGAIAGQLDAVARTRYIPTYGLAVLHAQLGDGDKALALLRQASQEGDFRLKFVVTDPAFDPLRSDPRFIALLNDPATFAAFGRPPRPPAG